MRVVGIGVKDLLAAPEGGLIITLQSFDVSECE